VDPKATPTEALVVSADLGGTNTRVALVAPDGQVLDRMVEATPRESMHPDVLMKMMRAAADGSGADRAVIGVPGRVDHAGGWLEYAPNLPDHWAGHLSEGMLADTIGLPVAIANDADLAAVGEHRFGAGRGATDMVYVTMSTGVGCGVIVGGKLLHGRRSLAEAGHTTIDRRADRGRRTLEETASGTAMNRLAEEAGLEIRGRDLVEAVRAGDRTARLVWDDVVGAAGVGVANLAQLFSPEMVVVGGGLGLTGDLLLEPLREALVELGPRDLPVPIRVVRAELGDDAGLVGAAGWEAAFEPVPAGEVVR
jgi:glucokinase